MKAQEIIDNVKIEKENNFEFFYPDLHKKKQTDENITKCLKILR